MHLERRMLWTFCLQVHLNDDLVVVGIPLMRCLDGWFVELTFLDRQPRQSGSRYRGLHTTIAWAMARSANVTGECVLDLMCGRGILAMEALRSCDALHVTAVDDGVPLVTVQRS